MVYRERIDFEVQGTFSKMSREQNVKNFQINRVNYTQVFAETTIK